jgi:2-polyprenyl-3-methyl-5-hydroxy-6-metoxy-1,4-benzoquinol methylase
MNNFDGAGNLFNKYESKNPFVQFIVKKFFLDFEFILQPVKKELSSVFEIGCGEGYVTGHINKMGLRVTGTDISHRIIEIAKKNNPSIDFFVLSVYDLKTLHTKYDLIVANEVFEHLPDPDSALEEIKKIAGKYILISVPNEPYFRIANIFRLKYLRDAGNTPGHINHWSKKTFENFLLSHKIRVKMIKCSTLWILALCEIKKLD